VFAVAARRRQDGVRRHATHAAAGEGLTRRSIFPQPKLAKASCSGASVRRRLPSPAGVWLGVLAFYILAYFIGLFFNTRSSVQR